ncbi:MAG: GNAT family N-acetyltransferase [Magnetococcales bacterium]|nr:GNAT family N-acetyltransferase [Magnetococcales bacterium]
MNPDPHAGPTAPDPHWQETYRSWVTTPERALAHIKPGQRIFVGSGCGEPQALLRTLALLGRSLADIEIIHLLTLGDSPFATRELQDIFTVNTFYVADNAQIGPSKGLQDYTPVSLSEIPPLFANRQMPLDVALIQVTPPDLRGMVSLGVAVDVVKSAASNAALVIAQVNRHMPRTLGGSFLHVEDLDWLVPVDEPLREHPPTPVDVTTRDIARHVASLVEDGATVEVGLGQLPQAILPFLADKHDLGIHSDVISDTLMELVAQGSLTGVRKSLDPGKIVTSFALGTQKLFDFVHNNPRIAFHPTEYVNDPAIISRQRHMVAINTALEVDLTGQLCADAISDRLYSGIGGLVDFSHGATRAPGGKSIIALAATAEGGKVSRIVAQFREGAGSGLGRGHVHYVVTEHGVAYLHGKSIQERVMAMISIAHPDFRAHLLHEAIRRHYVHPELAAVDGKTLIAPRDLKTTLLLENGEQIVFRPSLPTDQPSIREMLYSLSQITVYRRFMSNLKRFTFQQLKQFVYIDHRRDVILVGTIPESYGEQIIAVGGYYLDPIHNRAEVAFVVRDAWQGHKIGTFVMRYLVTLAKRNGIRGFTAETLVSNRPMRAVFEGSGLKLTSRIEDEIIYYQMDFQ